MNETKDIEILQELQRMSKLLALSVTRELNQQEKVVLLSNSGFRPVEISNMTGIKANVVSAVLSNIKKRAQTEKRKEVRIPEEVKSGDKQKAT